MNAKTEDAMNYSNSEHLSQGTTTTYRWGTDAASGELQATSVDAAVDALVAQREWSVLDSAREQRYIADGAHLIIHDADGCIVLWRGWSDADGCIVLLRGEV